MTDRHYAHVTSLQKAAFKHFKDSMRDFYLLNVGNVDTRKALVKLFASMGSELFLLPVCTYADRQFPRKYCIRFE
jgi:hypothetical protein